MWQNYVRKFAIELYVKIFDHNLIRVVDFPERIANLTKIVSEKGPWAENKKIYD